MNLISAIRAKEENLTVDPLTQIRAEGLDGSKLKLYGITEVAVEITNSREKKKTDVIPFVVMEHPKFHMVLGLLSGRTALNLS